jgi:thioredoxin 1
MTSFWRKNWTAMGGTALLLLAGGISLCTWTPGCFLSAAPKPQTTVTKQRSGEPSMLRAETVNRVQHVNSEDFEREVLRSETPVLVDFYADWCGPCRALSPVLEQVARDNPEAKIVKVNVDENPELALQYRVDSIPRLMVFKNGRPAAQHSGLASKAHLNAMLGR